MSKTKKVLSIILITLLILSTVFTLMKKVGLCASSETVNNNITDLPLPIGSGVGYDVNFGPAQIAAIKSFYAQYNISEDKVAYMLFNEASDSDNYSIYVFYLAPENPNYYPRAVLSSGSDLSDYQITFSGFCGMFYFVNGSMSANSGMGASQTSITISTASFLDSTQVQGQYTLKSGNLYRYPIYSVFGDIFDYSDEDLILFSPDSNGGGSDSPGFNHYFWDNYQDSIDDIDSNNNIWKPNYQNPTNQQGFWDNVTDFFNRSFKSLLGGISGGVKTIGDYIEQFYNNCTDFWSRCWDTLFGWLSGLKDDTADISDDTDSISGTVSSIDGRLASFFNNFWSNFTDKLEEFTEGIWGHLPDILKAPARIAQWFYTHGLKNGEFDFLTLWEYLFDFDSQTAYNLWSSNKYGDFILDVRDFFSNLISSITGVTASDRVFFTISLGDHFGVAIPDIEIDFSWYASIRDKFLPYLMAFLYVSVVWLFFKRLPDILKGVAGAESSFTDSLPYDTESTTYNGVGVYTSNTHVSNGGRSRVTYNSYHKL